MPSAVDAMRRTPPPVNAASKTSPRSWPNHPAKRMPCLVCGREPAEKAHWPYAVGMGRNRRKVDLPTVPLCPEHHRLGPGNAHADGWVVDELIAKAPDYWRSVGEWERAEPLFDRWLAKREYREATCLSR